MFAIGTVIVPVALKRVSDEKPGLTRRMTSLGFKYYYPDGRPVRDRAASLASRADFWRSTRSWWLVKNGRLLPMKARRLPNE